MKKLVGFTFLSMVIAGPVSPTHKSWVRYESGTSCIEETARVNSQILVNNESVWNPFTGSTAGVNCPIKLGGSFQDPAHAITQRAKVPSMRIQVFYYDANDSTNENVYCTIEALTSTGLALTTAGMESCSTEGGCSGTSPPVEPNFMGVGRLDFADPSNIINRRIGVSQAATASPITNYNIHCYLPSGGRGGWSGIMGYLTQTCQRDPSVSHYICYE